MARILIVEDDSAIRACLEGDLRLEGYQVETATDGAVVGGMARESNYDLILLDVMLPVRDGFEVCRDLRRSGVRTPILMLTARTEEAEKVLGLELGADDYVTKPFSPRELRARIKALLRRSADQEGLPEVYSIGDFVVDVGRFEIRRRSGTGRSAGGPVPITPIELRLLAALIRSKGRTLTREQLLNEAWGPGVAVTDRVVDNHITHLRRKIEPDPTSPRHVISVRGIGYRFEN